MRVSADMFERAAIIRDELDSGWLVVVTIPTLRGIGIDDRLFFAAAVTDSADAKRAVQKTLGGLHCIVEARIRMTPKAFARLDVRLGQVKRLPSY